MNKTLIQLPEFRLLGITARTNNAAEREASKAKIPATIKKYFHEKWSGEILNRKAPNTTLCVYTDYESDFQGDYTYFIGEEVTSFSEEREGLQRLTIPSQTYVKFTNEPGPMPTVCIKMWEDIWEMSSSDWGAERAYISDFEMYDQRSEDSQNTVLDIYVGLKPNG